MIFGFCKVGCAVHCPAACACNQGNQFNQFGYKIKKDVGCRSGLGYFSVWQVLKSVCTNHVYPYTLILTKSLKLSF